MLISRLTQTVASAFVFAGYATSTSSYGSLFEHERAETIPKRWTAIGNVGATDALRFKVALKQHQRLSEESILARSDPSSPEFGQFLSANDVNKLAMNKRAISSSNAVSEWLAHFNATIVRSSASFIDLDITGSQAEAMLDTKFSYFKDLEAKDGRVIPRTQVYSIPQDLKPHVDFIYPTVHFMTFTRPSAVETASRVKRQHGIPTGPVTCAGHVCPQNLTQMYEFDYTPPDTAGVSVGVAGFLEQYPSHTDLETFLSNFTAPYLAPKFVKYGESRFTVKTVAGGQNPDEPQKATLEAMLDLDYTVSLLPHTNITYFSTGGRPPTLSQPGNKNVSASHSDQEPFLELFDYLLNHPSPPSVLSISYSDDEQNVPEPYARRVCDQLADLAARGMSVIGSSGDGGAQGTSFSDCEGPTGQKRFIPTFPSSCPWITSVGATAAYGGVASYSSGGFSNYFTRPWYQAGAVDPFLATFALTNSTPDYYYNSTGRGYPDVSLIGDDFVVVTNGFAQTAKGTSASTPVFASMIALLNDLRARQLKPPVGFLNKFLYEDKAARAFRDVKDGNINGCTGPKPEDVVVGWPAGVGWDPASGLGEPSFSELRNLFVLDTDS